MYQSNDFCSVLIYILCPVEHEVTRPGTFSAATHLGCYSDDSQTTNFSMFSNPLFDDSTSSDEESNHEEIIHEMSFKTYSNPLFDLDENRYISFLPGPDDSIPPGIESDDYDSEVDDNSTSLPGFESFHVDYPDSGDSTINVVEDIPIDVPNFLPTHPSLHMDFDFIPSHNDLGSDLDDSSPSGDNNKIYNPGICIEVESTRILLLFPP
ncbi:hypothetical protein Tco_1406559 [Tanacetum coccineum]